MNKHDHHDERDPGKHAAEAMHRRGEPDAHPGPDAKTAMLMDEATGPDVHADHGVHEMDHGVHADHGAPSPREMDHGAHADQGAPGAHAGHGGHDAHGADHTGHEEMFRRRFWVSLLLSIPVLVYSPMLQHWLGFTAPPFPGSQWVEPLGSIIIFLYGGVPFLQMAVPELRARQPGMMTLISLAISVAFVYSLAALVIPGTEGFFWELVTLIDIMLLGHWIEMRSVRQASRSLDELAKLMPDEAERLAPDGSTEVVPVSSLREGDRVLVRPGASIPADGIVRDGASSVNEAMVTGESKPVSKETGDPVIAGTINGDGSLRVEVAATGEATALAGIMRLVAEAQRSKSRTQILADQAAAWLFYIALAVAALTAVAWTIALGWNVEVLQRVVTVLVIACPHALGLAVPLVVAITTSLGAQSGLLIRDRLALERARNVEVVLFDKTGTLTKGEHGVVGMAVVEGVEEARALALAAAVEGDSEHHIARGIRNAAAERGGPALEATGFEALKGRGVRADVEGRTVHVGGPRLLELLEIEAPASLDSFARQAGEKGQSVIHLVVDGQVLAAFALADQIRPESFQAIRRLHELGLEVAMITGDNETVARAVAGELGIDRTFANVLPEHKEQKVAALQQEGKTVAMVGDGVNDAPALTRADVGIAIGSGTDVAVASAGIILVQSNPLDVVRIIELSRASYRKMIQNLWWAAGYNIVALPLAAGAFIPLGIPAISPAVGAVLMSLSTIIVAINAQLLRREAVATG